MFDLRVGIFVRCTSKIFNPQSKIVTLLPALAVYLLKYRPGVPVLQKSG